jgi:hypothetical protein
MAKLSRCIPAILALVIAVGPAKAEGSLQLFEQEIEAGLLYNFIKYTQWPPDRTAAMGDVVVCLIGPDPFHGHLQSMAGRTVNRRAIEIRSVNSQQLDGCWLLYIHADEQSDWPSLQKKVAGKEVLTVANFASFAASGGMIEFTRIDDRIGVKINIDAVAAAHLAVQSRLLRLADTVHTAAD